MKQSEAYLRLRSVGVSPSVQRLAILNYLTTHFTHPTVDEVYQELSKDIPTLSRTTVYNTLRMFSEKHVVQMITIDDHRVCYDGNIQPHVHFFCKCCGQVHDLMEEPAPILPSGQSVAGHQIDDVQLYYRGICKHCAETKA